MAGVAQQAAAVAHWPRGSDNLSAKEQRILEYLRCNKEHAIRMKRTKRLVHPRATNKDKEAIIYRYKKTDRTGCTRVDVRNEELVEVVFNGIGDGRADLLNAEAGTGEDSKGEVKRLTRQNAELMATAREKQRAIEELGFVPAEIPRIFLRPPSLAKY